jgi:hypothetical protein
VVTADSLLAAAGTLLLGALGYLLTRNQSQYDKNLQALWDRANDTVDQRHKMADTINQRFAAFEIRLIQLEERLKAVVEQQDR